jgi:hypothetical protein
MNLALDPDMLSVRFAVNRDACGHELLYTPEERLEGRLREFSCGLFLGSGFLGIQIAEQLVER